MRVCTQKMDTLKSSKFEGNEEFLSLLLLFISELFMRPKEKSPRVFHNLLNLS